MMGVVLLLSLVRRTDSGVKLKTVPSLFLLTGVPLRLLGPRGELLKLGRLDRGRDTDRDDLELGE